MAQVHIIGRVTADLELQTSAKNNPYVRFSVAERLGHGEKSRTQYFQVWAWAEDATRLIHAKIKQGSLIWLSGSLELTPFLKKDGQTKDKSLKVTLDNWGFLPTGKTKTSDPEPTHAPEDISVQAQLDGEIDGERDTLPD